MRGTVLTGGCLCGAIRYELHGQPFDADFCHCRQCQRQTGAPVAAWMDFKSGQVSWLKGQLKEFASSDTVRRGFCPECGSTLSFRDTEYPEYLTLAICSLDEPNRISPNYHIHTGSGVSWLKMTDDSPRHAKGRSESDSGTAPYSDAGSV
ncbi:GFA family protein [Shewanella sp. GXUN23E]|uniref:GFA family protein n=1 Tax=Shewanella sp. GXUN23E TaxID=3422498 RepID=UPI003D7C5F4C